ncbi:MAG TPA: lmo0937 family membrane protein [Candidatus Eremiobacteraceae bacterium]|nr:lmo0937 family membrane protein [Candidatus Eremiobacteraceae bacterium]
MANVIWTILVILFVFWLIGLVAHIGGSLINILIVLVVIGVIYNLLTGRRAV